MDRVNRPVLSDEDVTYAMLLQLWIEGKISENIFCTLLNAKTAKDMENLQLVRDRERHAHELQMAGEETKRRDYELKMSQYQMATKFIDTAKELYKPVKYTEYEVVKGPLWGAWGNKTVPQERIYHPQLPQKFIETGERIANGLRGHVGLEYQARCDAITDGSNARQY